MTEIVVADKIVDLAEADEAKWAWQEWNRAKAQAEAAEKEVKRTRRLLDWFIGEGQDVLLGGVEVATYRYDGAFNAKKFTDEMPDIAANYTKWVAKEVFDQDAFAAENPTLFEAYRSRTLRIKKGD